MLFAKPLTYFYFEYQETGSFAYEVGMHSFFCNGVYNANNY